MRNHEICFDQNQSYANATGEWNNKLEGSAFLEQLLLAAAFIWARAGRQRSAQCIHRRYDYIVVGGGTAGCIVASRLSEDPTVSVLLLESGGSTSAVSHIPALYSALANRATPLIRDIMSEPQSAACFDHPERRCDLKVGNLLGGGASINSMIYRRGARKELDRWSSELGLRNWSFNSLLPYFQFIESQMISTEKWNGLDRVLLHFLKAGHELGYPIRDYNGDKSSTFWSVHRNLRNGVKISPDLFYILPVQKRNNLDIIMFAKATKVLFDENKRAVGVQFVRDGESFKVGAKREVILSSGALITPMLLMVSGIGPSRHLQQHKIKTIVHLPGVGQNLHDVLWCSINFTTTLEVPSDHVFNQRALNEWHRHGTGVFTGSIFGSGLTLSPNSNDLNDPRALLTFTYDVINDQQKGKKYFLLKGVAFQTKQRSRGQVKLKSFTVDDPFVDPRYMTDPTDRDDIYEAILKMVKLSETKSFRAIHAKPIVPPIPSCSVYEPWSHDHVACVAKFVCKPSYIFAGTARMGFDKYAVCDERLRVRGGVTGLRVADNSASPSLEDSNSMATAMVIGERASRMIQEDWAFKSIQSF